MAMGGSQGTETHRLSVGYGKTPWTEQKSDSMRCKSYGLVSL